MNDLDTLTELLEQATPLPWRAEPYIDKHGDTIGATIHAGGDDDDEWIGEFYADLKPLEDAAAIVAVMNAAPHLIAIAKAAEQLRDSGWDMDLHHDLYYALAALSEQANEQ